MSKVRAIFAALTVVTLFGAAALLCSAGGGGGNSVEQRIVGKWVVINDRDNSSQTWVFGKDGSVQCGDEMHRYYVTDRMLAVTYRQGFSTTYDASISSDGKTVILRSDGYSDFCLTKQD